MMRTKKWGHMILMTVLSGICSAIWLYRIFARGENDSVTVVAGILWTVCALIWGFRALKVWRESKES